MASAPAARSLLEMLLVIALIAATSVLAAAALTGGIDGMQLRSSAKEIAAQLRYTRAQAIATGKPQRFTIDPAGARLDGAERAQGRDSAGTGHRPSPARAKCSRARGEGAIVFFADGASTGGRVQLSAKRGLERRCRLADGRVRLRRG